MDEDSPLSPENRTPSGSKARTWLRRVFVGARVGTQDRRHHESNLVWGPVGIGAAIVLTGIAAKKPDLRILLIIAWLLFVFPTWKLCKSIQFRNLSLWTAVTFELLLTVGLIALGYWLTQGLNQLPTVASAPPPADPSLQPSKPSGPTPLGTSKIARPLFQEFTIILHNDLSDPQFYVNEHGALPLRYSSGMATFRLAAGSYRFRAEYPNWTCSAIISVPLPVPEPVPANCKLK